MKEKLRKKTGTISPGEKGWYQYVLDCTAAGICPVCGSNFYVDADFMEKEIGEVTVFDCPNCGWAGEAEPEK